MSKKIGAIGECMLELTHAGGISFGSTSMGFGGDTMNTLIYASRQGVSCYFFSALGDDPYSDWLLEQWQAEKVNTDHVQRLSNKMPGMYAIQVDETGERRFFYWRDTSAARQFVASVEPAQLLTQLCEMDVVYLSGISLSILDNAQRESLHSILEEVKNTDTLIAYDGNYRPKNWSSQSEAVRWSKAFLALSDWYLPTLDDDLALYELDTLEELQHFYTQFNLAEIVVKDGANGCHLYHTDNYTQVPIEDLVTPKDTTAAGDSFNAGYLAARLLGETPEQSAAAGNRLAGKVIQHPGAIIPKTV